MKWLYLVCRILLGALFIFAGVMKLHPPAGMKMPPMPPAAAQYEALMMSTGFIKALGLFEVLGGVLVLIGGTVPLGLCILCPITVNILLFDTLYAGSSGIWQGVATMAFEFALIYGYKNNFAGILTYRAKPSI